MYQKDVHLASRGVRLSARRSAAALLVGTILLVVLLMTASAPLHRIIAERYRTRGDLAIAALNFDQAEQDYQRAVQLDGRNLLASERLHLANSAEADIAAARPLFVELNQNDVVTKIDAATASFPDPKTAAAEGLRLYNVNDFRFARYPLETAVRLDPGYPEAWHYLALTYDKLAVYDATYRDKAATARANRDRLTPRWIGK